MALAVSRNAEARSAGAVLRCPNPDLILQQCQIGPAPDGLSSAKSSWSDAPFKLATSGHPLVPQTEGLGDGPKNISRSDEAFQVMDDERR